MKIKNVINKAKASKQAVLGLITDFLRGSPNWARTSDIMINSHALSTVYIHIPVFGSS